jgi:hypothetical protein
MMETGPRREAATSFDALRHPIRVRVIEACTDWGALSPIEIVNRGLCRDLEALKGKTHKQQLSQISYHCRKLKDAGLLTIVEEKQKRGATQHFYRANSEAYFSDDEWADLEVDERSEISRVMWQRFVVQVESAMRDQTFDARSDRWLAWAPLDLDKQGWQELTASIAACYAEIAQIKEDAEERLAHSGDGSIRGNYGLFGFESPRRATKRP